MTTPLASFDFKGGGHLTLYANRVVHDATGCLEIIPLAHLASVRVAYERDPGKLNWAIGLAFVALILLLVSGPLSGWSATAAARINEHAGRESLDSALVAAFSAIGALARLMTPLAAVLGAIAAVLGVLFALGQTVLTLCFAATERAFPVWGRNRALSEFAEVLGERLAQRKD